MAVLDTCLIPNSFYTVTEDVDDRLYVYEKDFSMDRYRVAKVQPGYYEFTGFCQAVEDALNVDERLLIFKIPGAI